MPKRVLFLAVFVFLASIAKAQDFTVTLEGYLEGYATGRIFVSGGVIHMEGDDEVFGRIRGNTLTDWSWRGLVPGMPVSVGMFGNRWHATRPDGFVVGVFDGDRVYFGSSFVGTLGSSTFTLPVDWREDLVFHILPTNLQDPNNPFFIRLLVLFLVLTFAS